MALYNAIGEGRAQHPAHEPLPDNALKGPAVEAWRSLDDVPVDDYGRLVNDEVVANLGTYQAGTDREEIWFDIEERFGIAVHDLMFPGDAPVNTERQERQSVPEPRPKRPASVTSDERAILASVKPAPAAPVSKSKQRTM